MIQRTYEKADNNFNSIKVRLEHASDYPIPELDSIFQFHKGAIRTGCSLQQRAGYLVISIP